MKIFLAAVTVLFFVAISTSFYGGAFAMDEKIVVLENGNELYQESTSLPFSVFKKLKFKNERSRNANKNEEIIKNGTANYIIFRISEIYGPNVRFGLIYELFHKNKITICDGERDFIYEGDLIYAIERAVQCDATGIFDIASGKSIKMKTLISMIDETRKKKINILRKKEKFIYNCENFKYFKWMPLVDIDAGLKVIKNDKSYFIK